MIGTLKGVLTNWNMFDVERRYGTVQNLPFEEAKELIMAIGYNGETGKGQQRSVVESHAKKLKKAMEAGTFTPTPVSAALEERHTKNLKVNKNGTFELAVDSDDPLPHTDGGHRFAAIDKIVTELQDKVNKVAEEDKPKFERWLNQAKQLPITVTVYFDGDPAKDFINLQAGKTADSSHVLSLSVQKRIIDNDDLKLAIDVAKHLNSEKGSPFLNSIRFDSRSPKVFPLTVSTLCGRGSSDIGTSLVGLSRIGNLTNDLNNAESLSMLVTEIYDSLKISDEKNDKKTIGLLEHGKVLTPIGDDGTKGSATMLVGLATCLAYRMYANKTSSPSKEDLDLLVESAKKTLDKEVKGNFSGPVKRKLLGAFAKEFLSDLNVAFHQGIPLELIKTLSASTFGVSAPKKEKVKKKKEKTLEEILSEEPQVFLDGFTKSEEEEVVVEEEEVVEDEDEKEVVAPWDDVVEIQG